MIKQLALGILAAGLAFAQSQGGAQLKERMDTLSKELNLTEDQKTKIEPILRDSGEKLRALRDEKQGDRRAMMKGAREIQDQNEAKIADVLTPEQKTKWETVKKEQREKTREAMREGRKGRRP